MTKVGTHFKKRLWFKGQCRICTASFMAADVKACYCPKCKEPRPCLCGCGEMASSALHPWRPGHAKTEAVNRGHKEQGKKIKGDKNPSRLPKTRKKLSNSIQAYWDRLSKKEKKRRVKNNHFCIDPLRANRKRADGFMSQFEREVNDILEASGIEYQYEKCFRFSNGRRFYPDFIVQTTHGEVLIEVSGFAYEEWKKAFVKRIRRMRKEGHEVICITYPDTKEELKSRTGCKTFTKKGLAKWLQQLHDLYTSTTDTVY